MSVSGELETLQALFTYLDSLTRRALVADLRPRLAALNIARDDVADYVRFGTQRYRRNLMRSGGHYHALILCWRSGQRSPIHNHRGSVCGVRVLAGVATETVFQPGP